MRAIWKYPLTGYGRNEIHCKDADFWNVLHVGTDPAGVNSVWVEVETPGEPKGDSIVVLWVHFTGDTIDESHTFVGTFQTGSLMCHVYMEVL